LNNVHHPVPSYCGLFEFKLQLSQQVNGIIAIGELGSTPEFCTTNCWPSEWIWLQVYRTGLYL